MVADLLRQTRTLILFANTVFMLVWINLVMLQLTSCLQEKGLLTVIVFRSLWLVKLFTKRKFIHW